MRVLIWATHLQTDILALTLHLDRSTGVELLVAAKDVETYLREPIAHARPLSCQLVDISAKDALERCRDFGADVVVADNHRPPPGLAPRFAYMWHGLGWKARSREDLGDLYRDVEQITGLDPRGPNPRFLAQCYGEPDRAWRIQQWGLHPDSCPIIGMSFTDLLLHPPYTRQELAPHYSIDVVRRKTLLMSLTWHYGGLFARRPGLLGSIGITGRARQAQQRDLLFLEAVFAAVEAEGGNVLFCMHERKRYESGFLEAIEKLARNCGCVQIKHKDEHPDNLADLIVADVMMTNLSSFITYFYVSGLPTIHVAPADVTNPGELLMAKLRWQKVAYRRAGGQEPIWMTDPRDNGGVMVDTAAVAREVVLRALREPDLCTSRAQDWLSRHVYGVDGNTADRFEAQLERMCSGR